MSAAAQPADGAGAAPRGPGRRWPVLAGRSIARELTLGLVATVALAGLVSMGFLLWLTARDHERNFHLKS